MKRKTYWTNIRKKLRFEARPCLFKQRQDLVERRIKKLSAKKKAIIIAQAEHCLDQLHANEESLESRLTLFLGFAVTGMMGIGGYMFVKYIEQPVVMDQLTMELLMMTMGVFTLSALFLINGLLPCSNYWGKGCTPYEILNPDEDYKKEFAAFEEGIIEAIQERCDRIDARNAHLARMLKWGLGLIIAVPLVSVTILFFVVRYT